MAWMRVDDHMVELDGLYHIWKQNEYVPQDPTNWRDARSPQLALAYRTNGMVDEVRLPFKSQSDLDAGFEALFNVFIPIEQRQEHGNEGSGRSGGGEELVPGDPGHSDSEAPVLEADPLGIHDAPGVQS